MSSEKPTLNTSPRTPRLRPDEFIAKWRDIDFGEKQASQEMFLDICALVDHLTPVAYGDRDAFTFEKWVPGGFADAYLEEHFGWEFKGDDADLEDGLLQLLRYQVHLKTPPLLIVSSFRTIWIQTNFPGMETVRHEIPVAALDQPAHLDKLRYAFFAPVELRPNRTVDTATKETAEIFSGIVKAMEERSNDPEKLARYLNQIIFCLYAEDAGLLPNNLFTRILLEHNRAPATFDRAVRNLFGQMAEGGLFGADEVARFNGDLFAEVDTVELSGAALLLLYAAAQKDWRNIEPSIFGTLFERALDASKRSHLGAHYTSAEDIMLVVEPVVMAPLRGEWEAVQRDISNLLIEDDPDTARVRLEAFQQRLFEVEVLDPACGSGNFLYLALRSLLDLEKRVIDFAAAHGWDDLTPRVKPDQMLGLEINPYAAELARTALWIGYIQWHQNNGFPYNHRPILTPLVSIRRTDSILAEGDTDNPQEPEWPPAEFIIGNPPFLGSQLIRSNLTDAYVDPLFKIYGDRIPNYSDLCCYWFEKARQMVGVSKARRVGLLATQGIRGGASRRVLERIKETGDIFVAHSDRSWVLEGAAVHVSIVCFDDGTQTERELDAKPVVSINSNLTAGTDLTKARRLKENSGMSFIGDMKKGKFEITAEIATAMLTATGNPHGRPNSEVVRRWVNALDITGRSRNMWIIDFDMNMSEYEASKYQMPFEYVRQRVKPFRDTVRNPLERRRWWVHGRTAPDFRNAVASLQKYIATPRVAKHRLFVFLPTETLPDGAVVAIARDDEYSFGVLSSRIHEAWALHMGTQLESRPRYSHTATFETFPFPKPTDEQREAIAEAARELDRLREGWLNPPDAKDAELKKRTLTKLYNAPRPTWLQMTHEKLDGTVMDAYGWPHDLADPEILERLLALNLQRAGQ